MAGEASEPGNFFHQLLYCDFKAGADINGFGTVIVFGCQEDALGGISGINELTRCLSGPPADYMVFAHIDGIYALFYQSRNEVAAGGVEIVAWAVEIYRDKKYTIEAVLGAISLRLDQHHFFGEAVRGVCLLGIAIPKVVFFEGDRGELGIRANGADGYEFFDISQACLLDELDAHHKVLIEEFAWVLTVCADTADDGGEVNDDIGFHIIIHPYNVGEIDEVVVLDFGDENIFCAAFAEGF